VVSGNDQSATAASDLHRRVSGRFGVLPNFFMLSPETPEITEKLFGFAEAAYLDNPLPSVLRNGSSSTFLVFALLVTALPAIQDS
jgi:hypothetical protein